MCCLYYISEPYLLWTDPFHSEQYVHILNIETGKEVCKTVQRGEGPDEFTTPDIQVMTDNRILVYDQYTGKSAILSIDSCILGVDPIVKRDLYETKDVTAFIFTKEGNAISFSPSSPKPFRIMEQKKSFGKLPFKGEISGSYDHFQGLIKFNPYNGYLFYSVMKIPYFALYKKEGDAFNLVTEELRTKDCTIKDNNLIYTGSLRGPIGATLTSNYIVTIENDPKEEQVDYFKIGLDYSKLPRSICLYDYELQLRKVIKLDMPIIRLASSYKDDTVYILGVNPDFIIYKLEL